MEPIKGHTIGIQLFCKTPRSKMIHVFYEDQVMMQFILQYMDVTIREICEIALDIDHYIRDNGIDSLMENSLDFGCEVSLGADAPDPIPDYTKLEEEYIDRLADKLSKKRKQNKQMKP
jgi:hypothetical protein